MPPAELPGPGRARPVVAARTARAAARSGVVWGYLFGAYVASSALGYAAAYRTPAARAQVAAVFGTDPALAALIGPAHQLDTVAGFTVWRCLGVLSVVGAVWGLLAGTRLGRGEEEAGRSELLLAGPLGPRAAAAQELAGLAAGALALWVPTAVLAVVVGRLHQVRLGIAPALWLSVGVLSPAVVFLAVGALAGQLAGTRRRAAGSAAAALGVAYALRMVADSGTGLGWLRWATPLGWVEELRPGPAPHPLWLVPLALSAGALGAASVLAAGVRDVGRGLGRERPGRRSHPGLLVGPARLAARLTAGTTAAWLLGSAAGGLLIGEVARRAGATVRAGSSVARVLARLGAAQAGPAAYLAIGFLAVAVLGTLAAAGALAAARDEEATGRLELVLSGPRTRTAWLAARLGVAAAAVVALSAAGTAGVLGAVAAQPTGVGAAGLVAAGAAAAAPGLCLVGLGGLVLGWRPGWAAPVVWAVAAWGVLVDFLGAAVHVPGLVLDTSLFHQMGAAPAGGPPWAAVAALAGLGLAAAGAGLVGLAHRDLTGP